MRTLSYDELTPGLHQDRALVHLAAFGGIASPRSIDELRRRSNRLAEYVGMFAVEDDRVIGQVFVERLPYEFPDGPALLTGIAAVATRPDRRRAGVARTLLAEVLARERAEGREHAVLWTDRSWVAHALYERLGFRDVYSPPWVVGAPPRVPGSSVPVEGIRPATAEDCDALEELHDRACSERLGFRRRPRGSLSAWAAAGRIDPSATLRIVSRGGRLAGYAHLDRAPSRVVCGELVALSSSARRDLLREVGRSAEGRPVAFQHTLVTDDPHLLARRGSVDSPVSGRVLMAARLGRAWSSSEAIGKFATDDPRFVCLAGDRF